VSSPNQEKNIAKISINFVFENRSKILRKSEICTCRGNPLKNIPIDVKSADSKEEKKHKK